MIKSVQDTNFAQFIFIKFRIFFRSRREMQPFLCLQILRKFHIICYFWISEMHFSFFFMPLPIKFWVQSLISIRSYSLLKNEPVSNCAKNLEKNCKKGKQHQSTKISPNQQTTKKTRQPRKLPGLLGLKSKENKILRSTSLSPHVRSSML